MMAMVLPFVLILLVLSVYAVDLVLSEVEEIRREKLQSVWGNSMVIRHRA